MILEAQMPKQHSKYEFRVSIDGIDIDEATLSRINSALQKALLNEITSINLGTRELAYRPIMSQLISRDASAKMGNGGSTGGIAVRAIEAKD
jgi:hypothetical protein